LNIAVAQRAHNHCQLPVTALSFTRLLLSQPTATHTIPCIIIIVTFHLLVLILVCEYVFTMDVFREVFLTCYVNDFGCRSNYRFDADDKIRKSERGQWYELYRKLTKKRIIVYFEKTILQSTSQHTQLLNGQELRPFNRTFQSLSTTIRILSAKSGVRVQCPHFCVILSFTTLVSPPVQQIYAIFGRFSQFPKWQT